MTVVATVGAPLTFTSATNAASTPELTTATTTAAATTQVTATAAITAASAAIVTPIRNTIGQFFPVFNDGTTTCENVGTPPSWMTRNVFKQTKSECCQNYAFQWDYEKCLTGLASDGPASYASIDRRDDYYYPDFEAKACMVDGNHPDWMAGDYLSETLAQCCSNSFPDEEVHRQCRPICPHCPSYWNDPELTEMALVEEAAKFCPGTYTGRAPTSKCSGYVDCTKGEPSSSIQDCPANTKFDVWSRTCTWPDVVTCLMGEDLLGQLGLIEPVEQYTAVPGRPFVGSDGRSLLASRCSGEQCDGRDSSWSEGTTTVALSIRNTTSYNDLGGEWTRNALGEHASVASFAAFSIALMSNRAPSDLVEDALNAALDEVRHAKISFDIASKLTGKEMVPGPLPPSSMEFRRDMEALALAVASEGCVDETLSALAAAAECELIDGALENGASRGTKYGGVADEVLIWIRNELRAIAVDEGNHSALAWRTLGWICGVDTEACEVTKQIVLNESALISAFRRRFGRDFEGHPELLERMLAAWTRIYTNSYVLDSGGVEEVSDNDITSQSLLSLLVENISRGSHRG